MYNFYSGRVPVLFDDGFKIYETVAIARYLIDKYQKTKTSSILIPSDPQKAALVDQFLSVENSYFCNTIYKINAQEIYVKYRGGTTNTEIVKEAREELNNTLDIYEKLLEGKDYIAGEYSLADIVHRSGMQYLVHTGHGDLLDNPKRPNVARWWKNISERDIWKQTISENPLMVPPPTKAT
jgi:glutathione S-transferase